MAVLRARRCLGMVLHRESWLVLQRNAAIGPIEQRNMRLDGIVGQRVPIYRETMVHRNDLDLAGREILHGMVRPVMTLMHFRRLRADSERQHLMAKADAESRHIMRDQSLDHGHGISACGGRITGTV